jgi:tetratricopeptide (TPR) repeat protein
MVDQTARDTAQAAIFLPSAQNPYFSGRQRVLDALHASMHQRHDRVQIITGMGGVGKTQLALEYACRHTSSYPLIWWADAGDSNALQASMTSLAQQLGIADRRDANELREQGCAELERRGNWLLILDDARDREAVRHFVPKGGGHILITSRIPNWEGVGNSFCLRVLERAEAIELLIKRSGRAFEPSAHTLCQALGDLPLALEQAAAVIGTAQISYADYLRRFEDHWAELLKSGRSSGEYPDTVAMTWELACREIERVDLHTAALLKVLAHLAQSQISLSFLRRAAAALPTPLGQHFQAPQVLESTLLRLMQFSLVNGDEQSVWVHRLVASLTRDRLKDFERVNWCKISLMMMEHAFPFHPDNTGTWAQCTEALPHALAVSELAQQMRISPGVNSKLLNQIGEYLQQAGMLDAARSAFERALALMEEAHGSDDPRRAAIVNNLGRVLTRMGHVAQAREYFETALRLDQTSYGENHPHVAAIANNFGTVLHMSGDVQTALHQFNWALEVCRKAYGDEHSKVATISNNIGFALTANGEIDRGIEYFMQALSIAQTSVGESHPLVATIRTNLGIALRLKGEPDAARAEFEQAAAIGQATLGPAHTDVARSLSELGALYFQQRDFQAAKEYFQRAFEIDERALGSQHLLLCARLNDLGRCLKALNDVDGSAACYERAAEVLRSANASATSPAVGHG